MLSLLLLLFLFLFFKLTCLLKTNVVEFAICRRFTPYSSRTPGAEVRATTRGKRMGREARAKLGRFGQMQDPFTLQACGSFQMHLAQG